MCYVVAASLLITDTGLAQIPAISNPVAPAVVPAAARPFDADNKLNQLIMRLVLKEMPHQYERNKGWGAQSERWDGIKWGNDGWKIKTHSRRKMVNHGGRVVRTVANRARWPCTTSRSTEYAP